MHVPGAEGPLMFDVQITYHSDVPDPTTVAGLLTLGIIAQYANAVQRQFWQYVRTHDAAARTAHARLTRGPLIEAMDDAMADRAHVRTYRCEVQSKVTEDGHAESVLFIEPEVRCRATVRFTTRLPQEATT